MHIIQYAMTLTNPVKPYAFLPYPPTLWHIDLQYVRQRARGGGVL